MTVTLKAKLKTKLTILKVFFIAVFVIFTARLVWLQVIDRAQFVEAANNQQNLIISLQAKRGTIYDRNNRVLAQDIDAYSYYVVPENIKNRRSAAGELSRITGESNWYTKFKHHPKFLWVARKTSKSLESRFEKSNIQTLNRVIEPKRIYPSGDLALPVLGRVDIDNNGLSGLELEYNDYLSGKNGKAELKRNGLGQCYLFDDKPLKAPESGSDIICSLDLNLQQIVEQEMASALTENNAAFGIGLFMKAGTGEILACAVLDSAGAPSSRNRAITDQYEPGSTFKIITTALALSSGKFELNDSLYVEHGKFQIGRRIIRDDHEYDTLSVNDILVFSSNIGVSKMALALGDQRIFKAIKEAGFVMPLGVDFPGEAAGEIQSLDWRDHYLANVSFGHGIAASPLQIVALYESIASGGYLHRPYIGKEIVFADGSRRTLNDGRNIRRVFDENLVRILTDLLSQVVQRGTATKAISDLVPIAGKTGTALKLREDGHGYDHRRARASFVGFFPIENPMVVGIVIFDSPKTSRYGGETAAPTFKNIAERYYSLPEQMIKQLVNGSDNYREDNVWDNNQSDDGLARAINISARYYVEPDNADVVPDFRGLTVRQALRLAAMKGITCNIKGSGIIANQAPLPGRKFTLGTTIELRCNNG